MAARVQPARVQVAHPSMHHAVAQSDWSGDAVLAAVRARVLPIIAQRSPIRALIVGDTGSPIRAPMVGDTGSPKKSRHSVGAARQYRGQCHETTLAH